MKITQTRNSIANWLVRYAYARGYRVINGQVIGLKGLPVQSGFTSKGYPKFSVGILPEFITEFTKGRSIACHKLAAYCYFGEKAFRVGLETRHLNLDKLDFSRLNIVMGTRHQNRVDEGIEARRLRSVRAARHPITGNAAFKSKRQRSIIRARVKLGACRKELAKEYGVSYQAMLDMVSFKYYADDLHSG